MNIPHPNSIHKKYKSMHLNGKQFCATGKSSIPFIIALALWDETVFGSLPTTLNEDFLRTCGGLRPIIIHYFALVTFSFEKNITEIPIAVCSWYRPHSEINKVGKPVQIWSPEFEQPGYYCFVPIHFVKHRQH